MSNPFFERPIVNSPYVYPHQHWELDESGQPTGRLIDRVIEFVRDARDGWRPEVAAAGSLSLALTIATLREFIDPA